MTKKHSLRWQDVLAAAAVTAFAMAIVVRPLPNLDLWWLLAVGRRIVETHRYIYTDPFSFTLAGTPWSPQGYASAILFFLLHKVGGMGAITVLRVALVGVTAALSFRSLRSIGASWAMAAPLVMVAVINSHSRLTDRGQLFEYVFIAWLMGFLLTAQERRGRSFFVLPVLMQLAWVQLHSSFLLGPALTAIFFAAEWVASRAPAFHDPKRQDFRRAAKLVLLMLLVCLVNPNPKAFLIQPFDPVQRDLLARFTLEWKSPFDPAIAAGNFHPYYEVLLGLAALAILLNLAKLPLAPLALLAATGYLSLQSHRFRVEFALVAVPMIAMLVMSAPAFESFMRRGRRVRAAWATVGLVLTLVLAAIERDRVLASHDDPKLYPGSALDFIVQNDVAKRPFHSIGFGSYLMWDLYGKRKTFIDGRSFDPQLYREFIAAQTNVAGFDAVIDKCRLDAFVLPAPARADPGMRNVHRALLAAHDRWDMVYLDESAAVYVARADADSSWLSAHAFRVYHPMTFGSMVRTPEATAGVVADLERIVTATPVSTQALNDLGAEYFSEGRFDDAIAAFERLAPLMPRSADAYLNLTRACAGKGDIEGALRACNRALEVDPENAQALQMREVLLRRGRQ
jgi:tetratricopeptide (TPR) repeat protein